MILPAAQRTLRSRMRRRRRRGKVIPPVVDPRTLKPFPITFAYGVPTSLSQLGRHAGEDHRCPVGSAAIAVSWGVVVAVSDVENNGAPGGTVFPWGPAYGIHVIVRTATGLYDYALCHLSRVVVKPRDRVVPGMLLGYSGATGHVTGAHLHLEARPAGGRFGSDIDPKHVKRQPPIVLPRGSLHRED